MSQPCLYNNICIYNMFFRYDMGTEAHPGVYSLSFLGHQDFQIEVNKTKFGDILKGSNYQMDGDSNVYLDSDAKFYRLRIHVYITFCLLKNDNIH